MTTTLPNALVSSVMKLPSFRRAATCDDNIVSAAREGTPLLLEHYLEVAKTLPKSSFSETELCHLKFRTPHLNLILSSLCATFDCAYYILIVSSKKADKRKDQFFYLCGNKLSLEVVSFLFAFFMEEIESLAAHLRTLRTSDLIPQEKPKPIDPDSDRIKLPTETEKEKSWRRELAHSISFVLKDIRKKMGVSKLDLSGLDGYMGERVAARRKTASNIYRGRDIEIVVVPRVGNGATKPWVPSKSEEPIVSHFHRKCREVLRAQKKNTAK